MRIKKSSRTVRLCNSVAIELRPNKIGFARDNHPHSTGNLLAPDSLSETIVLSVERPFIETCEIKDGIPQSLTWNSATADGYAAYHASAFNHGDTFPKFAGVD